MQRKIALRTWSLAVAAAAVLGTASSALAAARWGCWKYANYAIYFYNGASGSYYTAFQEEAKTDSDGKAWSPWTDVNLQQVSAHGSTDHINCFSGFYGTTGWAGLALIVSNNGCTIRDGHAYANRTYTDPYSMTWKKHVACHELGHLLGLDHTSSSSSCVNPSGSATIWNIHHGSSSDRALINSIY